MANQKPKKISQVIQSQPKCTCQTKKPLEDSKKKASCSVCGGSGWIGNYDLEWWEEGFGKTTRCDCKATADAQSLQNKIGTKLENVGLHSLLNRGEGSRKMIAELNKILETPRAGGFLTIYGKNGNGKSTALMAAVNYCLERDVPALYISAAEFDEYIKAGIGLLFGEADRLKQISEIPLLALDELTAVRFTDYSRDKIERLLDNRYRKANTTILAMDEAPAQRLHQRITSRLATGVIVENSDSDLRGSLKKGNKC